MSSTKINSDARHEHDYYVTPKKEIRKLFDFLFTIQDINQALIDGVGIRQDAFILDPSCGGDEKNDMSYPAVLFEYGANHDKIITIDIRENSGAILKTDFLTEQIPAQYDLIITNPPFDKAKEFIEKSITHLAPGGYLVMLLRLNFFGSKGRFDFWKKNMPLYTIIHSERMSFTENGQKDSIEYMHCVWKKGCTPNHTKTFII